MRNRILLAVAGLAAIMTANTANASTYLPVSDGSFHDCDGCAGPSDGAYVLSSSYIRGIVKFTNFTSFRSANTITFTLNPYGLPLFGDIIDLYGFTSTVAGLDEADNSNLTFIGQFMLPDLGYGEDAFFNVTSFVQGARGRYVGFNIFSNDTNVFSSVEYNYGNPSRLITTGGIGAVPEPATWAMMLFGFFGVGAAVRRAPSVRRVAVRYS